MSDIGMLFSKPMVLALLREAEEPGTGKTQTRRTLKRQPKPCSHKPWPGVHDEPNWKIEGREMHCAQCGNGVRLARTGDGTAGIPLRVAKGDRLWVRETCWILGRWKKDGRTDSGRQKWRFVEDPSRQVQFEPPLPAPVKRTATAFWRRNSIHMPRWASRLTLGVTDVRVERLQEITEADAIAEGLERHEPTRQWGIEGIEDSWDADPRIAYAWLWETINGDGAWDANPWVTATTFEVALRNIDA